MPSLDVEPFTIAVPEAEVIELENRLAHTRWPDTIPGLGWTHGIDLDWTKEMAAYWREGFDWREQEAMLNAFPQFTTTIDDQTVHFVHVRSPEPNALPLILTHGWPSTFADFNDLTGHQRVHQTRPLTLAYGLTDSPTGQLAWISDPLLGLGRFAPPEPRDRDVLLTNVSIYWFTKTAASSARWYFEDARTGAGDPGAPNQTPTGVALFPYNLQSVRKIAERSNNIVHWSTFDRGGHFAALDAPDLLVGDLRQFFRRFR